MFCFVDLPLKSLQCEAKVAAKERFGIDVIVFHFNIDDIQQFFTCSTRYANKINQKLEISKYFTISVQQ